MASLPELELTKLSGTSAGEGVERQRQEEEEHLRAPAAAAVAPPVAAPGMIAPEPGQLVGSSAGAGIARQEEDDNDLGSPAAAAAVPPPVPVADPAADRSAPELAGSSSGGGVESQEEEEDDARSPSAAAAAPLLSAPNTANRSAPESGQLAGSSAGREILEGGLVFMPNPMAVRYVYAALFAMMTIVAWIVRDIELPRFDDHYGCDGSHDCIAANGVLRVSMGLASFVVAAVVIIISTYTVGNDSKCIQFSNMIELADDVPYGYGFFHMVFASGATYIGMLFVGWNAHRTMEKWTVDVSWASTRVRATSGLVMAICYTLMLVSQQLWNLMLAVTSNSTPSNNEASPVGDGVVHPVAQ